MPIYVNSFFENRVRQLLDLASRIEAAFGTAGLDYRVAGGLACYLYVEEKEPDAGRLTKDIDIVVRRVDLHRIAAAVTPFGLEYRSVAGDDMLVQTGATSSRRAVHLFFAGEWVRAEYPEAAPEFGEVRKMQGLRLLPLIDLVRMKLTSFRLKDQMHLKDLENVGLLPSEIDEALSTGVRQRLAEVRARE